MNETPRDVQEMARATWDNDLDAVRRILARNPDLRFPDCSHTHEADCAVKDAVHWGQIHVGRYESYLKLYHQQPLEGD